MSPKVIVVCTLLCAATAVPAASENAAVQAVPRDQAGWMARHEATAAEAQELQPRLVFIGDSITHFWEATGKGVWAEEYAEYGAVNLGIAGDRTQHVLWRIERALRGTKPELVVVQIGTNNLTFDRQAGFEPNTSEEIALGVLEVVGTVRKLVPEAKILLIGLFPRADVDAATAAKVGEVNALLAEAELDAKTQFIEIGEVFLEPDGSISKDVMWDKLHLTEEGYRRWADAIRAEVERVLGDVD